MSKRVNVTLTDPQWDAIVDAVAFYEAELTQLHDDDPNAAQALRQARTLNRAFLRMRDSASLETLHEPRPGGRPSKPLLVKAEGICGVEPAIDSATCPFASLYRRRQGCQGEACMRASSEYYKERSHG